ncbi:MAG: TonB-dependent receptor [Bacteroidales bacterium]|nr:TonB-dependent receptor [Bacteroidales bacterium]
MKKLFSIILFIAFSLSVFAQGRAVTGKVTDDKGIGLPGVTILVKGTTTGTVTDIDGNYKINPTGNTLVFSFIGFAPQEINIDGRSVINVKLLEDAKLLDEVVVIGYGAQKKKDLTTAVSVVGEKELKDRPIVSAAQALQGKAAGVQVTQPSGKPGVGLSVRVRGATSVIASNEPLYVVDDVPTTDISGLSAQDIATMTVLKDASSSAIYGARAANGVVLITTKRGKSNEPVISFNTYYGVSSIKKTIDVLNTKQYRDLMEERGEIMQPSWTNFNDWQDQTFGTGHQQSYQLSVSGGDDKNKYFVSGGFLSEEGLVKPARFDRYSVRVNLDNEVRPWLKIGTNFSFLNINTKDTPDNASSGRGGVIMSALNTPPFMDVYMQKDDYLQQMDDEWPNPIGSQIYYPNPFQNSWENPVAYMDGPDQKAKDNKLFGSVNADIRITKGLNFKTRLGADITAHQYDYYLDPFMTSYGRTNHGIGRSDKANSNIWLFENTIDYAKSAGNHNFTAIVGSSIQKYSGNGTYIEGTDFPDDVSIKTIWAANNLQTGGTWQSEWALASFFGRVTYDYNNRYYLTVSTRRDGSSKLANHWGTMPSFSAGWRVSSERFMENLTVINDLKIRGGWGKNGNQEGISDYATYARNSYYRRDPQNPLSGPGSYQSSYGNPDLRWETTTQSNIGFDLAMFNSRLIFNFDAYYKETTDVLLDIQLTSSLPVTSIQTNAGEIVNKGLEFNLSTVNFDEKKFKWSSDINMSFNRNEVTKLDYTPVYYFGRIYSNNQDATILKVGLPLGAFYGLISDGVDPETGNLIYRDYNKNGVFNPGDDRTVIGYGMPDFIFGFTNNFSYERFSLNIFFQGSYGNDIFNATRIDLEGMFDSKNQSVEVLNRWTPENTITDIPRAMPKSEGNLDNVRNSTRFIEDGSYLRLKSITLSYNVLTKNQIKGIRNLSVYVTGQNLLTLTKYSGFDPEVNAFGSSSTTMGVDYGTYPQSRTIIFGLNVEF